MRSPTIIPAQTRVVVQCSLTGQFVAD